MAQTLAVGDTTGVSIQTGSAGEPLYVFDNHTLRDRFAIDVDQDGTDDLRLDYDFYYNQSGGQRTTIELVCLHAQIEVAGKIFVDTVRTCYITNAAFDSVFYNTLGAYQCQGSGSEFYYEEPSYYSPSVIAGGAQPSAQNNWHTGTWLLKKEDKSSAHHHRAMYALEHGLWVRQQEKYLVFKLTKGSNVKYGWLKLSDKGLWTFHVEELAFEK